MFARGIRYRVQADRSGRATPYAMYNLQARGELFIEPTTEVYEGMVIGEHSRNNCLNVNGVREKQLTNHRASGKDDATVVTTPRPMPLERCIEWIRPDGSNGRPDDQDGQQEGTGQEK